MTNQLIPLDIKNRDFQKLISVYQEANNEILEQLQFIKRKLKKIYNHDVINNISDRLKTPESIINKMKKKNLDLNYKNLVENINDIAGIRVVCPLKSDLMIVKKQIENIPNINILKEKNYIKKPKKSGYSAYHLIVEIPVEIENHIIFVKVEIQIRTMAMDFWSTIEHKVKYKSEEKISIFASKKLTLYAKIINILDNKLMQLYKNQELSRIK